MSRVDKLCLTVIGFCVAAFFFAGGYRTFLYLDARWGCRCWEPGPRAAACLKVAR